MEPTLNALSSPLQPSPPRIIFKPTHLNWFALFVTLKNHLHVTTQSTEALLTWMKNFQKQNPKPESDNFQPINDVPLSSSIFAELIRNYSPLAQGLAGSMYPVTRFLSLGKDTRRLIVPPRPTPPPLLLQSGKFVGISMATSCSPLSDVAVAAAGTPPPSPPRSEFFDVSA